MLEIFCNTIDCLSFYDREYSLNYGKSILVCAEKCGENGKCAVSTMCDRASNVCLSNGRSLPNSFLPHDPSINQGLIYILLK